MESTKSGQNSELSGSEEVLSDTVPSSEDDESENQVFTCNSCAEEVPSSGMYRCKTCAAEGNAGTHLDADKYFCHICIVGIHLRRKHAIIDHKGYEPSVCKSHKNLDEFFCETCRSVFCSNCTKDHSGHDFQMLEEKAVEVRKQVFDLITDNEALVKPFKHKEAVVQKSSDERNFQESLRGAECADKWAQIYGKVIRSNASDWPKGLEAIPTDYKKRLEETIGIIQKASLETDKSLSQLKMLLLRSEGCLIKEFYESERNFTESVKGRAGKLNKHIYLKWTIDIEIAVKNSIKSVMKLMPLSLLEETTIVPLMLAPVNLPTQNHEMNVKEMEVAASHQNIIWQYSDELFDQNIEGDECHFFILKAINRKPTVQKIVSKRVKAKFILFKIGFLAICLESNNVYVYSLPEKRVVFQFAVSATHIPLSLHSWTGGSFSFVVWSREQSQVQIPKISQFLHLPEQPRLNDTYMDVFAFVYLENTITVCDRSTKVRLDISNVQHGLPSIDKLKLADQKTLFLFDYRLRVIVKFQFDVSSEASLTSSLQAVFNLSSFADSPLKFVTVMDKTIVAQSESDEWF